MPESRQTQVPAGSTPFCVRRLQPALGAEISSVDLRQPITSALRDAIYDVLLQHKVIVFRDQNISREQLIALGRAFGELEAHYPQLADYPEIVQFKVDRRPEEAPPNSIWHTDHSCLLAPPSITVLRAYTVPSLGGDTMFVNAVAAYDGLEKNVKDRIENLRALHRVDRGLKTVDTKILDRMPPVVHPIVRIHPDTGERVLFVNERYTDHIVGLERSESDALLRHLTDRFKRPEYQLRFSWQAHSIAMWDNRSVQHCGIADYNEPRHIERVTVIGTVPVAPLDLHQPHPLPRLQ